MRRNNKSIYLIIMKCFMLAFVSSMLFFSVNLTLNILNEVVSTNNSINNPISQDDNEEDSSNKSKPKKQLNKEGTILLMSQGSRSSNLTSKSYFDMNICGKNWSVYLFAFSLGAFWNVKHLKKIGVV